MLNVSTGHKIFINFTCLGSFNGELKGIYDIRYAPAFTKGENEYTKLVDGTDEYTEAEAKFKELRAAIKSGVNYYKSRRRMKRSARKIQERRAIRLSRQTAGSHYQPQSR